MNKDGYINATKICEKSGKEFDDWIIIDTSKEYIDALASMVNIPTNKLMIKPVLENNLCGTYVHPLMIPQIASWTSPAFAVKIAQIV